VRDAKNAGLDEIASFFEQVMAQDAERAKRCHEYISQLISKDRGGPASSGGVAYSSLDAAAE
jgi:hypothetical protein